MKHKQKSTYIYFGSILKNLEMKIRINIERV